FSKIFRFFFLLLVIIESEKGLPPVNENTVLFKENRHSLGKIFEIFGPVSHPFYVVQFNSLEHIQSKDIKIKDAALDFSDDEKEKAAKSHKKSQNIKRKKLRSQQNDS
ncbi:H/ACA ribonucleoprotein complex non-core subunit NAF1, partial [Ophiophagus hannah]